ncbi:hypothetical protein BDW75DRAFT_205548 [Aspergillus navahoensis]
MCDVPFFFPVCIQCGTDQNPCRCKIVGPTLGISNQFIVDLDKNGRANELGFLVTIVAAVICWPASIFCGCGCTKTGKE